mmetsp:Transcript_41581/g.96832  ORF Transcript_41581/g.96832 Transcript_41581/m.96832 type:complete len:105 (+) Transcript_41581:1761-2075(+)
MTRCWSTILESIWLPDFFQSQSRLRIQMPSRSLEVGLIRDVICSGQRGYAIGGIKGMPTRTLIKVRFTFEQLCRSSWNSVFMHQLRYSVVLLQGMDLVVELQGS